MNICPVCGNDRSQHDESEIESLLEKHLLEHQTITSGGRELIFKTRGLLHLPDQCGLCDDKTIRKFLGES